MKKLLLLLVLGVAAVWFYFWYVRGINIIDQYRHVAVAPVAAYNPAEVPGKQPPHWERAAPLPTPRVDVGAAAVGSVMYVVGGTDGFGRSSGAVEAFDASHGTWTAAKPLPRALYDVAVGSDGKRLFAFGGLEGIAQTPVDTVYIYDPSKDSWIRGRDLPEPVGAASLAYLDGRFHLIGGVGLGASIQSHYDYDPLTDGWTPDESVDTGGRDHAGAAALGKRIYLAGGRGGSVVYNLDETVSYDPKGKSWEPRALMPSKRSDGALVALGGKLLYVGGEAPTAAFADLFSYDPAIDRWSTGIAMPTARHGFGAATDGTRLFVIGGGGRSGFSVTDANEVYVP